MSMLVADGWACDTVQSDYGEDIIAQPSWRGTLDPFRVHIQVKGSQSLSNFFTKRHGYSLVVPTDLLLKWVHALAPTIVILWDTDAACGVYHRIAHLNTIVDDLSVDAKRSRIVFDQDNAFTTECVADLGWDCRLLHYNQLVIIGTNIDDVYSKSKNAAERKKAVVAHTAAEDFLTRFGFIENELLSESFKTEHTAELARIRRRYKAFSKKATIQMCVLFLKTFGQMCNTQGVPLELCAECMSLLANAFWMEKFIESEVQSGRVCMGLSASGRHTFWVPPTESTH